MVFCQKDLNFEFVTDGHAEIDLSYGVDQEETLRVLHIPVRVIKEYNHLLIVSNADPGNVKMNAEVIFMGRTADGDLAYDSKTEIPLRIYIRPLDGVITIKSIKTGKMLAIYGSNPIFIPLKK